MAEHPDTKWLIVDGAPINNIDSTAAQMLGGLVEEMRKRGILFGMANLRREVKRFLKRAGMLDRLEPDGLFPTLNSALETFRRSRALP